VITPETIDRVREAADIVEIIGEDVKLRRSGGDWRGPCPFHGGKNPNFSVSPRRNAYHCFKCGVKGDAIEFVRQHLGMDFVDAVKLVGDKSGIVVEGCGRAARVSSVSGSVSFSVPTATIPLPSRNSINWPTRPPRLATAT
jgi:DNA primase